MLNDMFRTTQTHLEIAKARVNQAMSDQAFFTSKLDTFEHQAELFQRTADFLLTLGTEYETRIIDFIAKLVTAGVQDIFDEPWSVEFNVVQRAGQKTLDIMLNQAGLVVSVPDGCGGGVTQVIAVLTQICMVYLLKGQVRQFIAFDESLSHLALCYQDSAARVLKSVSSRLGIDILFVTHSSEMANCADSLYQFKKVGAKTIIQLVGKDFVD